MPVRPLTGIRVIDLAVDRGELCGRLLSDLGADVIKVEPPEGSPSRGLPPFDPLTLEHSLFFTMRNCGKRSVVIDPGEAASMASLESLLASADVLIGSTEPGAAADVGAPELEAEAIAARHRHLVVASITAYGRTGPYSGRDVPGSVIDATSGMCWKAGLPEREPLMPPGNISGDVAGLVAAFAVVCALIQRHSQGAGQLIDVSANEAAAQITDWSLPNSSKAMVEGVEPMETRAGPGPVYTILAAADGFVRLVVLSTRQWQAMRAWLGEPDYLQDPEYDGFIARFMIADAVLNPLYEELFSTMSMETVSGEAQRRGIVATPILKPGDVITNEHFEARKTFDRVPLSTGGMMSLPSGWMEIDGERVGPTGRPPHLGEHTDEVLAALDAGAAPEPDGLVAWPPVPESAPEPAQPLAGVRVADFGHGGVGVEISRMLAEYGADVIKIESRTFPDFVRVILGGEMSPSFASSSRSKRSLGINIKTDEGRQLLLDLAAGARGAAPFDVVVENGSTGVMDGLGLGYQHFAAANPGVVMVSSQLMGSSGPWSDWKGYGPNTQVTGGMTHLWDYPDVERPSGSQSIFPDHWAGRMGALAAVAGVLGRRRGAMDIGCHAEVCQVEQTVGVMGDLLARESLQAGSVRPQGEPPRPGRALGPLPVRGRGPMGGDLLPNRRRVGRTGGTHRRRRRGPGHARRPPRAGGRGGAVGVGVDADPLQERGYRGLPGRGRARRPHAHLVAAAQGPAPGSQGLPSGTGPAAHRRDDLRGPGLRGHRHGRRRHPPSPQPGPAHPRDRGRVRPRHRRHRGSDSPRHPGDRRSRFSLMCLEIIQNLL